MPAELAPTARRVEATLRSLGFHNEVVQLTQTARTAEEAAAAISCSVGQIVKSLVFKITASNESVLILASGANRVDEQRLADQLGAPVLRANAAFVRERTGYAIGGVAPVGHLLPSRVFIDRDLLQYTELWAAAGHPHAVFRLTPQELLQMTAGQVADIA